MIVDLFCGAGGASAGSALAGHDPSDTLGFEHDRHAAATHTAAGFPTIVGDLSSYDPTMMAGVDGLWGSPPCQAFSLAGKGAGRDAIGDLLAHIDLCAAGWVEPSGDLCADDVRADLTLQPLRWADALRPRWVVLEQVPPVLPAWEHMARVLDGWGYSTWCGLLSAERWGVPQTRRRAILIARNDGTPAAPPTPTHTAYDHRAPDGGRTPVASLFDVDLLPWVSMADALGWADVDAERRGVVQTGANTMRHQRDHADDKYQRTMDAPAPGAADTSTQGVRVSVEQAAALQSFPDDWPWQGPKTSRYRQIGNAVPPLLAAAILRPLLHPQDTP